jgi:hypothetical protein
MNTKIVEALRTMVNYFGEPNGCDWQASIIAHARTALAEHDEQTTAAPLDRDPPMLATLVDAYAAVQQEHTERKRFEAWYAKHCFDYEMQSLVDAQWDAWQAAMAQRKPLSDEQIALAMLAVDDPLQWGHLGEGNSNVPRQFARAIEAAHGINQ